MKRLIITIAILFIAIPCLTGHLRSVEGALSHGKWIEDGKRLTDSEAEEVLVIWRVIKEQEIVTWYDKEWMAKTEKQKQEAIKKVCKAWEKAGY